MVGSDPLMVAEILVHIKLQDLVVDLAPHGGVVDLENFENIWAADTQSMGILGADFDLFDCLLQRLGDHMLLLL